MDYTRPTIVDYGDVTELTAAQNYRNIGDALVQSGQELGVQNSTGRCQTGTVIVGGICTPLPPF
jgi:hypothetical protein